MYRDVRSDSSTSNLASWFSVAGLSSLSPPPHLPSVAAAVTAARTSIMPLDQYTRVMSTKRRTVGDNGHSGGDQLSVGLARRPVVLYTDDRRDVRSSTTCPSVINALATASNNNYCYLNLIV